MARRWDRIMDFRESGADGSHAIEAPQEAAVGGDPARRIVASYQDLSAKATMTKKEAAEVLSIDGREVRISNPDKLYFSRDVKLTKLDVVQYYLSVAGGAVAGIRDRPSMLKRFVNGA